MFLLFTHHHQNHHHHNFHNVNFYFIRLLVDRKSFFFMCFTRQNLCILAWSSILFDCDGKRCDRMNCFEHITNINLMCKLAYFFSSMGITGLYKVVTTSWMVIFVRRRSWKWLNAFKNIEMCLPRRNISVEKKRPIYMNYEWICL